ncbi:MAG: hypothetical protein JWQ71_945 [Pedosphaera sp.]|nr:hypothetical protein [Pedosphaera sp.]
MHKESFEGFQHGVAVFGRQWLGLIEIGTMLIASLNILAVQGRGKDDDFEFGKALGLNPFQNLKAVHPGHLQIEQQQIGEGMFRTIAEPAFPLEIVNGFDAIRCLAHNVKKGGVPQRQLEQETIILKILREQDLEYIFRFVLHRDNSPWK